MIRTIPLLCLLALCACETIKGVSRDITRTAEMVDSL